MNLKEHLTDRIFNVISDAACIERIKVFAIGGFVRDILLQRPSKDIDIVVDGDGIDFATKVAGNLGVSNIIVYKNFGTALLKSGECNIEFIGARKESYRAGSRKPLVDRGTLNDDMSRRDFTINALAVSLGKENFGELSDPFNGLDDLRNKIIRTPLDPDKTFSDDPLRMLRAIRFSTQLNFIIEPGVYRSLSGSRERIKIVSAERITDELNKIISSEVPSTGFKLMFDSGLLHIVFPQLAALQGVEKINGNAHKDNFYHTLKVLDKIASKSDNLWLRWAALLHDIAKPATKRYDEKAGWTFHGHEFVGSKMARTIFRQMRLPLDNKLKYVEKLVLLHLRPIVLSNDEVTDSAVRRLLFDAGNSIDDLMLLCEADITSKNDAKVARYMQNLRVVRQKLKEVEERDKLRNWQPPVTGHDIMKLFHLPPGKIIGVIKDSLREAIIEGHVQNTQEDAHKFVLAKGKELGLTLTGDEQ